MINLFRKTRKRLFKEKRIQQYLLYAVGEILLVMIGILLALQVNTWNEQRKDRELERNTLSDLFKEFERNKEQFHVVTSSHHNAKVACMKILELIDQPFDKRVAKELEPHLYVMTEYYTFDPSESTVRTLINQANFNKISNDSLRMYLIGWTDLVEDYQEDEKTASKSYFERLEPFLNKHFVNKIVDPNSFAVFDLNNPAFDPSILTNLEFRNYLYNRFNDLIRIEKEAVDIRKSINDIIRLLKLELNEVD